MAFFSKLGIILSSVFCVIFLGLVAELYYFFWWKKKSNKNTDQKKNHSNLLLSFLFQRKTPVSAVNSCSTEEINVHKQEGEEEEEEDLEAGNVNGRETLLKEESVESELIRLHNLCGPPRFLFTIKEETKEDLMEYEDHKGCCSRSRKSLNDLINDVDEEPILSPLFSPPIKKMDSLKGFNPLFESLNERELNKLRSSPPPKFKFLRDAEEKLIRKRLVEEDEEEGEKKGCCFQDFVEEKDASFIGFLNLNMEKKQKDLIQNSCLRKVLPLATSP